jgi:predicted metalloprotease with PDZ domain
MRRILLLLALLVPAAAAAQEPVEYALSVDSADLSGWAVEMRIADAPRTMRLAMAAHPEYDDRFWRYVRGFSVQADGGAATVVHEDSAVWRVEGRGGEVTVRYRIQLPPAAEGVPPAWTPFLAPTGGLVGGPHAFMYVLGREDAPARVTLRLPRGWQAATSLERRDDGRYAAPDVATLLDSPVLVGRLRTWSFEVQGTPHRVAYWPLPDAAPFDTVALVDALRGIAGQASALFGGLPYREYVFLLRDGAYGGLEHANSTTLGAMSQELAGDRSDFLLSAAHEYFHAWNLMRLRPAGWGGLSHRPPGRTRELWWSEGVTMWYADVLLRRAGLVTTPRLEALAARTAAYWDDPGTDAVSPEQAGWTAEDPPEALEGPRADHYLAGEMVAWTLDLVIRDRSGGRVGLDDVMRRMVADFPAPRGYTGADLERTASAVCECDLSTFFEKHVRGTDPVNVNTAVYVLGMRALLRDEPAMDPAGRLAPDLRVFAYVRPGETEPRLLVTHPRGEWARAGLRTGDVVVSLNGAPTPDRRALLTSIRSLPVNEPVHVVVQRGGEHIPIRFVLGGYRRTHVELADRSTVTPAQRAFRERWLAAAP